MRSEVRAQQLVLLQLPDVDLGRQKLGLYFLNLLHFGFSRRLNIHLELSLA